MKKDYLWDKTGKDPEIEQLEILLSEFRFNEKTFGEKRSFEITAAKSNPRMRFAFAFASVVSFVVIIFGVLTQFSDEKGIVAVEAPPELRAEKVKLLPDQQPRIEINRIDKTAKPKDAPRINLRGRNGKTIIVREREIHKIPDKPAQPTNVKLTREEKYAYDQLMLALSITSAKLGLVKDKIAGVETQQMTYKKTENNRRN